jgi:long-chain acyl-CoA synthetase
MLLAQADRFGERPLLWSRSAGRYRPLTWREIADLVCRLAEGLEALGIRPGDRVVLVAENRPEWLIADFAIMATGAVTVPAYTTNTEADHRYILEHSGARAVIVSTSRLTERVMAAAVHVAALSLVVTLTPPAAGRPAAPRLLGWEEVLALGQGHRQRVADAALQIGRDDLACIIYTSGTGGAPKGVMLHHGAILHNCAGAAAILRDLQGHDTDEVFLSLLPLSHAYEHTVGQCLPLAIGGQIYYAEGVDKVLANLQEARPTIVSAVPRFYELVHQRLMLGLRKAKPYQQRLLALALERGRRRYHRGGSLALADRPGDWLAEVLVRRRVRQRFGGRLRAMVSGGAPLNVEIGIALRALGLPVFQGYGQTEASPLISVNHPRRVKLHTVGPPLRGVTARVAADGEILVQGEMLMQGYWRNPDATAEALRDGWLHTGDVGEIDADGDIRITDRKKDLIINSGGENVSPAKIEGLLCQCPEISQAMIYGDRRPHVVALIVPDPEWMDRWVAEFGKPADAVGDIGEAAFRETLTAAVDRVNESLSQPERIRRFAILAQAFSVDNGQLTPTMKIRRHVIRQAYGPLIDSLYD